MLSSLFTQLPVSPFSWTILLALPLIYLWQTWSLRLYWRSKLPLLAPSGQKDLRSVLLKITQKYIIPYSHHDSILLPREFIPEIVSLPESKASLGQEIYHTYLGRYTTLGKGKGAVSDIASLARIDLTRHLAESVHLLYDEAEVALPMLIGSPDKWKTLTLYSNMAKLVGQVTARVFVGETLCRNDEWVNLTISYTSACTGAADAIWKYPSVLHPLIAPLTKEVKTIKAAKIRVQELLTPLLHERKGMEPDEMPNDSITWYLQDTKKRDCSIKAISALQMALGIAAIHTTTSLITNVLYDLCAHPECQKVLRDEWNSAIESEGQISKKFLSKLKMMDSLIRETQRTSPSQQTGLNRYVASTIKLSDGTTIPKGSFITFSSFEINNDPECYPKPTEYDPWRFAKMRQESVSADSLWQLVHTDAKYHVNFGHGKHACPGRFFASNEIKIILGIMLSKYDFQYENGLKIRPPSICRGSLLAVDPTQKVQFKSRLA